MKNDFSTQGTSRGALRKTRWFRLDILLISLLISLLSLALPITLLQVYDRILPNYSYSTTAILVSGVAIAIVIESLLRFGRTYLLGLAGSKYEHQAGHNALRHMLASDIATFESVGPGEHLERFNSINTLREFYSGQAILALFDLPFTAIFLALIWYLGGSLVLIPLIVIALLLTATLIMGRRLGNALKNNAEIENHYFDYVISVIKGLFTVKALSMESQLGQRSKQYQEKRSISGRQVEAASSDMLNVSAIVSQISVVAVAAKATLMELESTLTVGALAACTLLVGRSLQPLQNAISFWTRYQGIQTAHIRFNEIFSMPLSVAAAFDEPKESPPLSGALELRDVNFEIGDRKILTAVNLSISPGEMVVITGPNGSGKSILLSLIRGLTRPTSGEILLDGREISDIPHDQFKEQVALLPQQESLFHGTILENLTLFRDELKPNAVKAAELLGFAAEINSLPKGFNTLMGESSEKQISRGLKQRIAIARALVTQPRYILFDDANAAVDQSADEALKQALIHLKENCSLIIVTHRPSIMRLADRIHDLRDGHLESKGLDPAYLHETAGG